MGGVSVSRLRFDPAGYAVFEGVVSLENNGGFASVRTSRLDLGSLNTVGYLLTVWGDGKAYKFNLRTDMGFDGINYQAIFTSPPGRWSQILLPLADLLPSFRGKRVPGASTLQPEAVKQVGLMISDQQAGPFRLMVKAIEAVSQSQPGRADLLISALGSTATQVADVNAQH
jgi:hypothetical protein